MYRDISEPREEFQLEAEEGGQKNVTLMQFLNALNVNQGKEGIKYAEKFRD